MGTRPFNQRVLPLAASAILGALVAFVIMASGHQVIYPKLCAVDGTLWAAWAQAGVILASGIAATWVGGVQLARLSKQLQQDAKFNRAVQTGKLIDEWNAEGLRRFRQQVLDLSPNPEVNHVNATRNYDASFRDLRDRWDGFIEDTAALAERILLYTKNGLILKETLYDHLGYDIISTYNTLKTILARRTYDHDYLYDSFRDLMLSVKAYAREHPEIDIRAELLDAPTPELVSKKRRTRTLEHSKIFARTSLLTSTEVNELFVSDSNTDFIIRVNDETIDKMAEAMFEFEKAHLKDEVSQYPVDVDRFNTVFDEIIRESDRVAAILAGAFVDDIFDEFYRWRLNPKIPGGVATLLEGYGPLATLSGRVNVAYSLKWLGDETFKSLNLMRKIRNHFAHDTKTSRFDEAPVRDWVDAMPAMEAPMLQSHSTGLTRNLTVRERFLMRAIAATYELWMDLGIRPRAVETRLPDGSTRYWSYEDMPENFKALLRGAARKVLELAPLAPAATETETHSAARAEPPVNGN